MSDPTRSVPDYVKAAQAGEPWTDILAATALGFTESHGQWLTANDVSIDDAYPPHISCWEPPPIATGTDGRLLVEVLDALAKVVAPVTVVAGGTPQFGAWATVAVFLDRYDCNWFIAASAALLVSLNQLQEK